MSIYGLTKGTDLEKMMDAFMKAESNGAMMYMALARVAKEQGYIDAAEAFEEIAIQESIHSGFYAVLNGKYPQDFWKLVAGVQKAEAAAEKQMLPLVEKFKELGMNTAANEMSAFMDQETNHGIILDELLSKYAPEAGKNCSDDVMADLMK